MPGRWIRLVVLGSVLGCTVLARAEDEAHVHELPSISVSGTGKIFAVPDVAEVSAGVIVDGTTAEKALADNSTLMAKVMDRLKEQGIAAKDIQTTQIQVNPRYSQPSGRVAGQREGEEFIPRLIGYRVSNTVTITARKVDKLGSLLDMLIRSGANQLYGISFRVDNPEKLLDSARKEAVADAKRKAEQVAGEAGVVLGSPLKIEVDGESGPQPPRFFGGEMRMMAAPAAPVAAGEQELRVNVRITYRIKEAK
ncbi:SIMPL domain-containing protein [Singulisphaera sp. PoT]|uniref:SIMPL domain-containing protein n=1 Tax=Singulisphaera sp. PoT TaxID=3411797 RepID=UPI003BF4E1C0